MVDKFIYPDLTQNIAPLGSDIEVMEDDPNGTPLTQYIYKGANNLLPDGYMLNGKIAVTVATNNLTVAIKTKSGGNPSLTDPVSVWINGNYRRITAALSVTKNAGTNWFSSGGAELATQETDYFAYLIWNTTPATDIMDIGFARIPSGRVYSDFSVTTTNEKYLAYANASAPTSTDDCVVIGRFAATLSAGAGYTWTVPTFTNKNLIQTPICETQRRNYIVQWTSSGTAPALLNGTLEGYYQIVGLQVKFFINFLAGSTTTFGTGNYTWSLPFISTVAESVPVFATDTGTAYQTAIGSTSAGVKTILVYEDGTGTTWGAIVPFTWANTDKLTMTGYIWI